MNEYMATSVSLVVSFPSELSYCLNFVSNIPVLDIVGTLHECLVEEQGADSPVAGFPCICTGSTVYYLQGEIIIEGYNGTEFYAEMPGLLTRKTKQNKTQVGHE